MRVLRISMFPPDLEPATMVIPDTELKEGVSIEDAIEEQVAIPGIFITNEVFEAPDQANIVEVTLEATERMAARIDRERNMAVLFYYNASVLPMLTPNGVLTPTKRAPLSADEIEVALHQLARHPNYEGQTVLSLSEDQTLVLMRDGKCERRFIGKI